MAASFAVVYGVMVAQRRHFSVNSAWRLDGKAGTGQFHAPEPGKETDNG